MTVRLSVVLGSFCLVLAGFTVLTYARHGGGDLREHATAPIAAGAASVHYAPGENLEPVDVALIDRAKRTIDLAAYVLTDRPVLEALTRAARRGIVLRILVDRGELDARPESDPLMALQDVAGVTLRVKRRRVLMHLKSYAVDGRWLRTGSANFTPSGLKRQDNDLVVLDSPAAAARFEADFGAAFAEAAKE